MKTLFYLTSLIAVLATVLTITRASPVHALLYLMVSFLAVAMIFLLVGAPFVAALEVIIYAGAIVVLFLFVVMMVHTGRIAGSRSDGPLSYKAYTGPLLLVAILGGEVAYVFAPPFAAEAVLTQVGPQSVGKTLLGSYVIGVELASMLLLPGLVGAYYLGRRVEPKEEP